MKTKTSPKKKTASEKVSYHKKPVDMATEKYQTLLRKQFAETQPFTIKNIGAHPVYSDFKVYNPLTKNSYKVAIRSTEPGPNFCSCMDFKTNLLNTCKHLESVFIHLNNSDINRKLLSKPLLQSYTSVYLHYSEKRSVKIRIGSDNSKEFTLWAKKYFDENLFLREEAFEQIEDLLKEAKIINEDFRCYDDAMEFIISERSKRKRALLAAKLSKDRSFFDSLIRTKLFPYQKEGILFAMKSGRCLLADDMGLGKTIQAIAAVELMDKESALSESKVLVVCPTSLKYQWKTEIEKFSSKSVTVVEGNLLKRETLYSNESFYKIISYNVVKSDVDIINAAGFDMVILDEAQRIKNWKTKVAQNVKKIKSTYAIVLTGTPLENKLEELYSILQFVDSFKLGPLYHFLESHQITNENGKVTGYKNLNKIGALLSDVVLRRTKKEVLSQLPERTDKNLFVTMTANQSSLHNEYAEAVVKLVAKWKRFGFLNEKDRQSLMIFLNMMRMVCDSTFILDQETRHDTKIDELMNIFETFFSSGDEKAVVFSQWERMTRLVALELDKRNIQYEYLHGGIPSADRKNLFENFNNNPKSKVFLSTDAGGVGLNLQAASLLINLDIPWNPAVLEQRIGRIYRLGQKRNVSIINLVSSGTIEHRMLDVLKFKSALAKGILDNGEDSIFMGESKFKAFMKNVENITTDIKTPALAEEGESQINRPVEDNKGNDLIQPLLIDVDTTALTTPEVVSSLNGIGQNGNTDAYGQEQVSQLVTSGFAFLGKLAQTLADKEATEKLVKSFVSKDESGKTFLKIQVENEKIVENAFQALGNIFKAFGKQ